MAGRPHGVSHTEGGPTSRSHGGDEGDGSPRVRTHGGAAGSVVQLTAVLKAKFAAGKVGGKDRSVVLANKDAWDAHHASTGPKPDSAVLYLHDRSDFHGGDFRRKALDLADLGDEGRLETLEGKTKRPLTTQVKADKFPHKTGTPRTLTNIYRDRIINRLSKAGKLNPVTGTRGPRPVRHEANQQLLNKLYQGKNPAIRQAGVGLDPDHVHELQLKGEDVVDNLRLMDSYTNRQMGGDIKRALAGIPPNTPVTVRLVE